MLHFPAFVAQLHRPQTRINPRFSPFEAVFTSSRMGLEIQYTFMRIEGSNPSLSASSKAFAVSAR